MQKSEHIQQELNDIGISLPVAIMPDMALPDHYFQQLSTNIQGEIHQESFLASLPKNMPYDVPINFFDDFNNNLLTVVQSAEIQVEASRQMPYHVPANYFDNLPVEIFTKINSSKTPLRLHTFSQKWLAKLSLAATLLLFMGIAFKQLMPSTNIAKQSIAEQQLSTVSDAEINQYLLEHESEIESSLVLESVDATNIDLKSLETEIFDKSLNNISDEELLQYQF